MENYLFRSQRLGFRNWRETDLPRLFEINADEAVMEFFPACPTKEETLQFICRMQKQYGEKGYCYFAVDKLENGEFIGFIGLSEQDFGADFTPCVDIGWRLKRSEWGKGFAKEGAKACLNAAFELLNLQEVCSMAPLINVRSVAVMHAIGMERLKTFEHPKLLHHEHLKECVLYRKRKNIG